MTDLWFISAAMVNIVETAADKKELDDLVSAIGDNRLHLREPCMAGTRTAILQEIEEKIKNVDGPNVIWIRGFPGVGKSALAASIAIRLQEQHRHVIWFRFDRTQSTTITTDDLWRAVACSLARLYPCLRKQQAQGSRELVSSDVDRLLKSLIETPLSMLNNVTLEELPVIVIDALDECGGLRHDPLEQRDHSALLRTLQRWAQVDCLKRFKLVITSRQEDRINKIFPESICIRVNIPSGSDVKPGDSASDDIRIFLKSRLEGMGMEGALIDKALDYLVLRAAGVFIWATTVANFLERDPEGRFAMLEEDDRTELDGLHSLYSTIVKVSFGPDLKGEEPRAVVSVLGAMIFAKEPLDDNALIMLPGVKIPGSNAHRLGLIRKGLVPVIDPGPILRFNHRSFEDFLLSPSFPQQHPGLSDIQNQVYHEHQLTVLCLKTLVSPKLHFNICSLESSTVKSTDIQVAAKNTIPPLISYSCQYWADHLVHTPSDEILLEAVQFVMYEKLLFWLEVMSLLDKTYEATLVLRRALAWKVCLQFISCNISLMLAGQTLSPDHDLVLFILDALRFISAFIIPISQSAPQIYVSSLSFVPERSLVATKFCSRFPNTVVVTEGRPSQWPMTVFTAEHHKDSVRTLVFSPDESTFASISGDRIMCVCDSETGHCISGPFELSNYVYEACFSPDGRRILLRFKSYAVVLDIVTGEEQFRIKGKNFVFIHCDGKIASTNWIDENKGGDRTGIVVKLWDASNGALISNRLFEVNDVACTRFSDDGRFLAVERKTENVIELWNLKDGKDPRRFLYPPGNFVLSLHFSLTSDSLMAIHNRSNISLWRLDTQGMASFSHDFNHVPHVIHSPLTNYLFIKRDGMVEIWDVFSVTRLKPIWETNPPTTSRICSTCPSQDGHRLLVGCRDGSVRMWELDLENLAMNQVDTMNTQAHADVPQFAAFSRSGKMVATKSKQSHSIEVLYTATGEVIARAEFDNDMDVVFSPDEDQAAFWFQSLITVCDLRHPKSHVSLNPLSEKDAQIRKVVFQTRNDLVIYTSPSATDNHSASLRVWHWRDPAGFECMYSLDFSRIWHIYLAPDGLTIVTTSLSSSAICYSWNHNTAQFDFVDFDDQVHIRWPEYSPDGKLFVCQSDKDSHIRVWNTRTGQLVSKFPTSWVDKMALSPFLIEHSPGNRLIALWYKDEKTIHLIDVYSGRLYARIWSQGSADMVFIRDGTKLAQYSRGSGLRIWDIADLMHEHWHSIHGYEPILRGMRDGWVVGRDNEPLFWVPVEHRKNICVLPLPRVVPGVPKGKTMSVDLSNSRLCNKWTECVDKEWLKEVERKGKEVGNLLEKCVLPSAQVLGDVQMDR